MPSQFDIVNLPGGTDGGADESKAKSSRKDSSASRTSTRTKKATDTDLRTRLGTVIDKIIRAADARGDDELADTLKEDRDIIVNGIVSVTSGALAVLRVPIFLVLTIVEPVMAFSRIGRLILDRVMGAREERAAKRAEGASGSNG